MANELKLTRGDSVTFSNYVKDNGAVFDLTDYDCYFTVKTNKTDSNADAVIGPITGVVQDISTGLVTFSLDTDDTDVTPGTYYYDIRATDGTNDFTIIESTLVVNIDVNRTEAITAYYATAGELRTYLQFDANDYPSEADMNFFLKVATINVDLDLDTSNENILFIATLLNARFQVMKALAAKAVSKGYIQVNAEGRTITKAYQEFVLDAENTLQEYKEFLMRNGRREATSTNFMDDTTLIDSWTRQDIIYMMNGTTNAEAMQKYYGYGSRSS